MGKGLIACGGASKGAWGPAGSRGHDTHSGCQLQASSDIFGPEFVRVTQAATSQVQFRDLTLNLDQIDDITKGKILWDLYKHNFRFELAVLDHLLVPQLWSDPDHSCLDKVCQVRLLIVYTNVGLNFTISADLPRRFTANHVCGAFPNKESRASFQGTAREAPLH